MIRKFLITVSSAVTVFFLVLSIQRLRMDYNEEGVYFDGLTTYDSDAIVGYVTLAVVFLLITFGLMYSKRYLLSSKISRKER